METIIVESVGTPKSKSVFLIHTLTVIVVVVGVFALNIAASAFENWYRTSIISEAVAKGKVFYVGNGNQACNF